ncbi:MAG TPA: gamma-glutamylcyclotransferase family protein [Blastocatellia bacterium]|nr:gamma-glutamylcyclotransferase family protein [Blastocatellia bacterium]
MKGYLFVYGTLLPGHAPDEIARVAEKLRLVGPAHVRGQLYDLGDYPGAILDSSSDDAIFGQVFELPDDESALRSLDSYEGFDSEDPQDSLFIRRKARASLDDGRTLECWVYAYNRNPQTAPLIESGNYVTAISDKEKEVSTIIERSH